MALSTTDCQQLLDRLKAAYYNLLVGEQEIEVKYRERTLKYNAGNIKELKNEIMKLETQCGCKKNGRLPPVGIRRRHVCR